MIKYNAKLAGGMAAAVALATAFTATHASTTPLYSGGGTLAEKVYRDVFNQFGNTAGGDTCVGLPTSFCAATPYRSDVEALYVGVGSGNGKKAIVAGDASLYVAGGKKPDNPPVPSTRDFGPFYGTGTGSSWAAGTGVGPNYPKVTFSGSDDPLTTSDVTNYNAKFGSLIQVPGLVAAVAVAFNPTTGWNPQGKLLTGGSSKVNLSTNTICGIFTGAITNWNDPAITKDNNKKPLGSGPITVVYRHDGSGTTFLFTNALLNQCGVADGSSAPKSAHPFPTSWLTAAVQGTAIAYTANPTPILSTYYSNDNFFINVFNAGLLPSNFINNSTLTGYTGGANGSGGVQRAIDATPGAIGYISPDFVQPVTTGNDSAGHPVAAAANVQTYATFLAQKTSPATVSIYVAPTAKNANFVMQTATPPSGANAALPINWGVVNPTPTAASAYPFGGFTFLDLYTCYGDAATVNALASTTAGKLGLFRWYYGTAAENGGTPAATLAANGFSLPPTAWVSAIKTLMFTNTATKIGVAKQLKTGCTAVKTGA